MSEINQKISLQLTERTKNYIDAFMVIHSRGLAYFRDALALRNYVEVTEAVLHEIIGGPGKCDANMSTPNHRDKLDAFTACFDRSYFVVSNDRIIDVKQGAQKNELSHSTTIELATLFRGVTKQFANELIYQTFEDSLKISIKSLIDIYAQELLTLGADLNYLSRVVNNPFIRINYNEALVLLNEDVKHQYAYGDILGEVEEKKIASYFCNMPVFIEIPMTSKGLRVDISELNLLLPKQGLTSEGYMFTEARHNFKMPQSFKNSTLKNLFSKHEEDIHAGFKLNYDKIIGFLLGARIF